MNLFLSYGHPESEICEKIRDALIGHGHEVWIDTDQIKAGHDWRVKIQKGIHDSNGVIACLSKHSVRDPGVCLNELSIAVGVRGGNIKTILLEKETEVQPPPTVSHLQWLDMSDWRERKDTDPEEFEKWFQEKMEVLFSVVESDESQNFVGQITAIRKALPLATQYNASRQYYLLSQKFVGRQWLTQVVEDWLHDPNGERFAVLYGDAGIGKSAFAAQYLHHSPSAAAGFFCEYDKPHFSNPCSVVQTLAYLLACRLPAYRMQLVNLLDEQGKSILQLNAAEQFNQLLTIPLSNTIDGKHETLCIVIDALDECRQDESTTLLSILRDWIPLLPPWLRVLATARDVENVKAPLSKAHRIYLHGEDKSNLQDVRSYYKELLEKNFGSRPNWKEALDTLTERSGGVFLYATLTAQGILNGQLDFDALDSFPIGLSDAFHHWFGWICPSASDYKERLQQPLGTLLAAGEPLPVEELERLFGWDENDTADFLSQTEVILRYGTSPFGKQTIELSHKYLADWLRDRKKSGVYFTSRKAAVEHMARCYIGRLDKSGANVLTAFEAIHLWPLLAEYIRESKPDFEEQFSRVLDIDYFWKIMEYAEYCQKKGNLDFAERYYHAACRVANLADSCESTQDTQRAILVSNSVTAVIKAARGDLSAAMELCKGINQISEKFVAESSIDFPVLPERELYISRGLHQQLHHDWNGAIASYTKVIECDERAVLEDHSSEAYCRLAYSYLKAAEIQSEHGDTSASVDLMNKAKSICDNLVSQNQDCEVQDRLALAYWMIAKLTETQGDIEGALEYCRKDVAIREKLVSQNPTLETQKELADSYSNLGDLLEKQCNNLGVIDCYKKAIATLEEMVAKHHSTELQNKLAMLYLDFADMLEEQGDLVGALAQNRKNLALCEEMAAKNPTPELQEDLAFAHWRVAWRLEKQGDIEGALENYRKDVAIREKSVSQNPTLQTQKALANSYSHLGYLLEKQCDNLGVIDCYKKAIATLEEMVAKHHSTELQNKLAMLYLDFADMLEEQGDLVGALAQNRKNLALHEEMAAKNPTPELQKDLAFAHWRVAWCLEKQGKKAEELEERRKEFSIYEMLLSKDQLSLKQKKKLIDEYDSTAYFLKFSLKILEGFKLYKKAREIERADAFPNTAQSGGPHSNRTSSYLGHAGKTLGDFFRTVKYGLDYLLYSRI